MSAVESDVLVVGGSLAGCATAVLLARQGLSVTVLEQHRDPAFYKRACTHFVQACAVPVLDRLGLTEQLEAAGAVPNHFGIWTRYGWVRPPATEPHGYNLRRSVLDPMVRELACGTSGVEMRLGVKVAGVLRDGGRVVGVRTSDDEELRARLVVGADGRHSKLARAAGVKEKHKAHGRFGCFALFEGVRLTSGSDSQMWISDPGVDYAFPNDGGLTVLAHMDVHDRREEFARDLETNFLAAFAELPDGPDLSQARRVGDHVGMLKYPDVARQPGTAGLGLVGDAALTTDYLWGVGCGWALQSAEWLADTVGPELGAGASAKRVDASLKRYAAQHRKRLRGHHFLISDGASGRPLNAVERLMFAAAPHDEVLAANLGRFGSRTATPTQFLSPRMVARSLRVRSRAPQPVAVVPAPRVAADDARQPTRPAR